MDEWNFTKNIFLLYNTFYKFRVAFRVACVACSHHKVQNNTTLRLNQKRFKPSNHAGLWRNVLNNTHWEKRLERVRLPSNPCRDAAWLLNFIFGVLHFVLHFRRCWIFGHDILLEIIICNGSEVGWFIWQRISVDGL